MEEAERNVVDGKGRGRPQLYRSRLSEHRDMRHIVPRAYQTSSSIKARLLTPVASRLNHQVVTLNVTRIDTYCLNHKKTDFIEAPASGPLPRTSMYCTRIEEKPITKEGVWVSP